MEIFLLRVLQQEVALQCRFVLLGGRQVSAATSPGREVPLKWQIAGVWFAVQNTLAGAANLSKLLWESGSQQTQARDELRTSLEVDDSSCLRSRDVRNAFEHFDERLERWTENPTSIGIGYRGIMPFAMQLTNAIPPPREFGRYDPEAGIVRFWDAEISLVELVAEAERLLLVAEREAAKSPR